MQTDGAVDRVANDNPRGSILRSARLPALLLVGLLAAISGSVLWLTLMAPPPEIAAAPSAKLEFGPTETPKMAAPASMPKAGDTDGKDLPKPGPAPAEPAPAQPPQSAEHKPLPAPALPVQNPTETHKPAAQPQQPAAAPAPPETPMPKDPVAKEAIQKAPMPKAAVAKDPVAEKKPSAVVRDDPAMASPLAPLMPKLPRPPPSAPLPRAPDPALIEDTKTGPLPIVGRDGREAWRVYGRPFTGDGKRPKIAVVLYGLGSSAAATKTAIQALPGAISLAFSPYADGLHNWIADARAAGHEALLMVPMEPDNFPQNDPGPQALLTSLTNTQNTQRLEWILGRAVGYVGITDFMGSRFTNSTPHMRSFFRNLKLRGLMYLESNVLSRALAGEIASANRVPFVPNGLYIDRRASRTAIDAQLVEAERLATRLGEITVMGFVYPVTLERVANWAKTLNKRGLVLAPVSALAKRR